MAMSDGLQTLQAVEREHGTFRLMRKGAVLDLKTARYTKG